MKVRFAIALALLLGATAASGQDFLSFKGPTKLSSSTFAANRSIGF